MALRINHNPYAQHAVQALNQTNEQLGRTFARLSTGLRIATAADDPAGLAMSERLRARVRSVDQSQRNAQDGISLVQVAEGALREISTIVVELRELAVQAGNGTLTDADRATLQEQFDSKRSELDRIAQSTEYAGIRLLDGSRDTVALELDIDIDLDPMLSTSLDLAALDIGSSGDPSAAITAIDGAQDLVSSLRGSMGASQSRLDSAIRALEAEEVSLTAAESRIRDADLARQTAELTRLQILQQTGVAVLAQANAMPQWALQLLGGTAP